jgi:hypothetical protein
VVAALEVLETVRESGVRLSHPLTAVNFNDSPIGTNTGVSIHSDAVGCRA